MRTSVSPAGLTAFRTSERDWSSLDPAAQRHLFDEAIRQLDAANTRLGQARTLAEGLLAVVGQR